MGPFLLFLTILTVITVVAVLFLGIAMMLKGGELNKKYGNKLMTARVILQGAAIGLLALLWFFSK